MSDQRGRVFRVSNLEAPFFYSAADALTDFDYDTYEFSPKRLSMEGLIGRRIPGRIAGPTIFRTLAGRRLGELDVRARG